MDEYLAKDKKAQRVAPVVNVSQRISELTRRPNSERADRSRNDKRDSDTPKPHSFQFVDLAANESNYEDDDDDDDKRDHAAVPSRRKFRKLSHDSSDIASDLNRQERINHDLPNANTKPTKALVPVVPVRYSPTPPVTIKRGRGRPRKDQLQVHRQTRNPTLLVQRTVVPLRFSVEESRQWMQGNYHVPFVQQLMRLHGPPVTMINDVDDEEPPESFRFINEYVFREGTQRLDKEARTGCSCRPQNGRNIGCEYTYCDCLEDAGDESKKLGFPYFAVNNKQGCLRDLYLDTRHMIYECNELCNCPPHCKNKVVQKGRQLPLDIFKTRDRGWGLRCPQNIRKGEFVDVYLGEVVTDAEARRREKSSKTQKNSYLFALDKFKRDETESETDSETDSLIAQAEAPIDPDLFVVDGEHMGGPSRFVNHSCNPNLRIFTVSLYRGDSRVYELAFFAIHEIPAGTELTFDYMDHDPDEGNLPEQKDGQVKCLCGAENCRGYLWI